ncbi:hypothetical protein ABZT06_42670 [Streptomyces sp. NPDC005483]|uniref:ABC transporter ATP-binding protein n=1 Tax=Streptomyces sp. NPDC005483 TaxID=3154882 RepID=UPI0033A9DFBC
MTGLSGANVGQGPGPGRTRGQLPVHLARLVRCTSHLTQRHGSHPGQIMEAGPARLVTHEPAHHYTRALLLAAPMADPAAQRQRPAFAAAGERPSGDTQPRSGCTVACLVPDRGRTTAGRRRAARSSAA